MAAEADVATRCCKDMTKLFGYVLYLAILAYAAQVYNRVVLPPPEFANFNTVVFKVKHVLW